MDYTFPILIALWVFVVAILHRRWEVRWEKFVQEMEASLERRPDATNQRPTSGSDRPARSIR